MTSQRLALLSMLLGALPLCGCSLLRRPGERVQTLTLLTWNLLHGADEAGTLNIDAKGAFLAHEHLDLAFVQEIDERCTRSGGVDQMAVLGRATGLDPAFGGFMEYQGGHYGLGMLSGLPVRSTTALPLPEGDEPRVALIRDVEVSGKSLLAVCVHFNWTKDDTSRFAQARALLDRLEATYGDLPVIVAGDFNDVPESRTLAAFYEAGFRHAEPAGATWSASAPIVDIDHILIRGTREVTLEPLGGEVMPEAALSDHRPVLARIRVRRAP